MAILSDYQEAQETKNSSSAPSSLSFNGVLDPSNPLGFVESALNFAYQNSDLLKRASDPEKKISSLVRNIKQRIIKGEEEAAAKKLEKEKKEKEKEEKKKLTPNKTNGLDMEDHSWGQNLQEVTVSIPVPQGTKSREVLCEVKTKYLKVGLKGQSPIIEGELFEAVKPGDSYWSLEDQRMVSVLLTKCDKITWWKSLFKGGPEIDTQKAEPEPGKLSDLDAEMRSTVEKMMFDERQKQLGLPTTQEIENQEMLKKFMAQNPNFDFANARIM